MPDQHTLDDILKQLPQEYRDEVRNYAQFLLETKVNRRQQFIGLSWVGGLREFREQYTAMELQNKSLEWWGG